MFQANTEQERVRAEYGRIVIETQSYLIHRALSLTGDRDEACDLVQATLERGLRSFARFQPGSNAMRWLSTIMVHHFIDEFRHAKLYRREPKEAASLPNPPQDEDPSWTCIDVGEAESATKRLPDHWRLPFELRVFAGLSYREIAKRLDLPMNTVSTRIHRARRHLRETLLARVPN